MANPTSRLTSASCLFCYEDWVFRADRWASIPSALHVFTDIELLSGDLLTRASTLHQWLRARSRVLNDPHRSLKRLALHQTLAAHGINDFQSYSLGALPFHKVRFPAFLRRSDDHEGSRSELLRDAQALTSAIEGLSPSDRSGDAWIVTEYLETADAHGWRHKFSAFCIGGTIVPRHLFFNREWMIKKPGLTSSEQTKLEREYLETNPHEAALKEVFRLAGIDYGRVDYALVDGRPQVWEINTNPMVFRLSQRRGRRQAHHQWVQRRLTEAWSRLVPLRRARGAWLNKARYLARIVRILARELPKLLGISR